MLLVVAVSVAQGDNYPMDRLTTKKDNGKYGMQKLLDCIEKEDEDELVQIFLECIQLLGKYEDLNYSPEELAKMIESNNDDLK